MTDIVRRYFLSRILRQVVRPIIPNRNPQQTIMAEKIAELQKQNAALETQIVDIVGKLEELKGEDKIRLKKDMIMKPASEAAAEEAAEKLAECSLSKPAPCQDVKKVEESEPQKKPTPKSQAKDDASKPVDVSRLDLRVGKIIEVIRHPDADSLYVEKIDCGDPTGPRTVISGLVNHVPIEQMKNRMVIVLCNLKPAKMRGILSEAMVMCASTPEKVEILIPPSNAKPGDKIIIQGFDGEPDTQLNPKKKIWEQVAPDLKVDDSGIAVYKNAPFMVEGVKNGVVKSETLKGVQVR